MAHIPDPALPGSAAAAPSATPSTSQPAVQASAADLPEGLLSKELERRLLKAIRGGASMEDIAEIRPNKVSTPEEAIQALEEGNARFFSGQSRRPEISANERRAQIIGQTPFAAVLACSDSRVPVELVFDQGLGDLFVVRVAGNVMGEGGLGTLEYAIRHLQVHLILVLGHEGCGAVAAAMLPQEEVDQEPPHLRRLIGQIQPSVCNLPPIRDRKARMREAVISNVRTQVQRLREQQVIREAEASGSLRVIGGFYEIGSGAVDLLTEPEELRVD